MLSRIIGRLFIRRVRITPEIGLEIHLTRLGEWLFHRDEARFEALVRQATIPPKP